MKSLYTVIAFSLLLLFGYIEWTGWGRARYETVPNVKYADLRNNPGTYRSHYHAVFIHHK